MSKLVGQTTHDLVEREMTPREALKWEIELAISSYDYHTRTCGNDGHSTEEEAESVMELVDEYVAILTEELAVNTDSDTKNSSSRLPKDPITKEEGSGNG